MDFKCPLCGAGFYYRKYLLSHNRRVHGIKKRVVPKEKKHETKIKSVCCQQNDCNEKFYKVCDLRAHLVNTHHMKNLDAKEELNFENFSGFLAWLAVKEEETTSKFRIHTKKKRKDFVYYQFKCSRSGFYKPKGGERERKLKAQGSKKIGFHCTAGLLVKEFTTHVSVIYYLNHYNHDTSLCHVPIPKLEKDIIAGKLLQGISEKIILHDIRQTVGETVERRHLITNKDLQNIKRDYGITVPSKGTELSSEETSVHSWVERMKTEKFNPVLFYKRQDEEHLSIDKKDFMLVLMTNFQKNMFFRFGYDRICVDSTNGMSGYQFELVTVLTVDEYEEGIPVAFCITSTVDTKILSVFFHCIKTALSCNINPRIFMSDDAIMFKNAWVSVFGPCSKYLLCPWHVDQAWQKHLNSLRRDIREDVYKTLKSLMYELDEEKFKVMLKNFCDMLEKDNNTKVFYNYFMQYYYPRCEMWAYCFRKGAKRNTYMHIEDFHKCLKHIYVKGKKIKRIDRVIIELITLVNDKNFDAFMKASKGKIKKTTENFKRHKIGTSLNAQIKQINENKWEVSNDNKNYTVIKLHECSNSCLIACRNCAVCTTAFECSCLDYMISNFICKHIHFLITLLNKEQNFTGPINLNSSDKALTNETLTVLQPNFHKSNKLKISSLIVKLNKRENMNNEVSKQIMYHLNAIEHLLQTEESSLTCSMEINPEPYNEKITKQKRFYSVKKSEQLKKIKLS